MHTEIVWKGDVQFDAPSGSGHTLRIDGPEASGGVNAGPRPMELVLMGVGTCASYDVVTILKKSRESITGCTARLEATRADEPPRVYTHINMHFVVSGHGLTESKVARAVHLSADKYCSASIMMARGGVEITHTYEIVEEAS